MRSCYCLYCIYKVYRMFLSHSQDHKANWHSICLSQVNLNKPYSNVLRYQRCGVRRAVSANFLPRYSDKILVANPEIIQTTISFLKGNVSQWAKSGHFALFCLNGSKYPKLCNQENQKGWLYWPTNPGL